MADFENREQLGGGLCPVRATLPGSLECLNETRRVAHVVDDLRFVPADLRRYFDSLVVCISLVCAWLLTSYRPTVVLHKLNR